jgi:ATP synthase protein I
VAEPGDHDRRPEDESEGLSNVARSMQRAEPYFRAAWNLTGGVALGVIAGYFADRHLGTAPWLLVTGSVLGMAAGMYGFFKAVADAEKRRRSGRG